MTEDKIREMLLTKIANAAIRGGAAVMSVHDNFDPLDVTLKSDKTPLIEADRLSHHAIKEYLGSTRIPILSEEGREMNYEERRNWELFWLVDPLDGTLEFIEGSNEFTVNVAIMENNTSIASAIFVPYHHKLYIAMRGRGAYVCEGVAPDAESDFSFEELDKMLVRLPRVAVSRENPVVALSRLHKSAETYQCLDKIRSQYPDFEVVEQGSSYKFCLLAEGAADIYVRTTSTYEWDTAAGELILQEAGGEVCSMEDGELLQYNKQSLANPWFVCRAVGCKIEI